MPYKLLQNVNHNNPKYSNELWLVTAVCGRTIHSEPSLLCEYKDRPGYKIVSCVDLRKPHKSIINLAHCDSVAEYLSGGYNLD